MTKKDKVIKRCFDLTVAVLGLILFSWVILIFIVISAIDTNSTGIFTQERIGFKGRRFHIFKIRTMKGKERENHGVAAASNLEITAIGGFIRKTKIDELPQLFNVLLGNMSLVGPRPDLGGFADHLVGEDSVILSVRPGITGPASLHFRDEEELLKNQENPIKFNKEVIWPEKVRINKNYIAKYSFKKDLYYLVKTIFSI